MESEVMNKNSNCVFNGSYAGRDLYITMYQDNEREFVVTHNANIKPVPYFTGRETELQELRKRIEAGNKLVLVSGMGGIGKTQICRLLFDEYRITNGKGRDSKTQIFKMLFNKFRVKSSEDAKESFSYIGYIEYNEDMGSSLQNCLKFKEQDDSKQNQKAAWKELEYLASKGKLLLFVDNVNVSMGEDSGLKRLMSIPGAIVLASRRRALSKEFEPYRIGFLSTEECREIYEKIRFENSRKKVTKKEVPDLEYIIHTLAARHTITVELLAHLARTNNWTVKELREKLEKNGFQLEYMDEEDKLVNIQKSYETLYDMSVLTEAEQNILEAFSIFPYIPLKAEICNQWLLADIGVGEKNYVLTKLYQKGWLQFDIEQESYSMHPVFAQFIYEKCRPTMKMHAGLVEACRRCLEIPKNGVALECRKFIPFAENIVEKLDMGKGMEQVGFIAVFVDLLLYVAEYKKAENLSKRRLEIERGIKGENHLDTAKSYNNLAYVYEQQGELDKAEKLYEKSLRIKESILGEEHPETVVGYNNLAGVYESQGKYKKAKELYEKNLRIRESLFGEEHSETAMGYNNLAVVYERQGEYKKAEELYEKGLRIRERVLGEEHRYTARSYYNLGEIYARQGEYKKAEELYEKSLRIKVSLFGEEHPDTANSYNSLAEMYEGQGEYKKAKELYEKSLGIKERTLGKEHPDTARSYDSLAGVYESLGEYKKAEELYEKSLGIWKRMVGEEHPGTARSYNNLAVVYVRQGKCKEAEKLYEKSLDIMEGVLGKEHPDIVVIYNNLAVVYKMKGKYKEAEKLYEKSLDIIERVFGKEHPNIAMVYNNLAGVYFWQKKYEFALSYYIKAYNIYIKKFGFGHPNTRMLRSNMEMTYIEWNPEGDFGQWLEEKMKD